MGWPEFGTIPILYQYLDRLGMDIEYPNTNIFKATYQYFDARYQYFRQDIDILRQAKVILKPDIIVIRHQNIYIWSQLRSHV